MRLHRVEMCESARIWKWEQEWNEENQQTNERTSKQQQRKRKIIMAER